MNRATNLLILMSDEHQARALSCAGHFVETPNLDRLAARGTRFTNAYTPSPICVPARASFATGQYVHQTRLWDNSMPYCGESPSWGNGLQAKGVPVESIGKLHFRSEDDQVGFDRTHIPMMVKDGVGMVFASIRDEQDRVPAPGRMLGEYIGPGESNYTKYDAKVVEQSIKWLDGAAAVKDPWCLYVGLVAPHFPLVCPEEFYNRYPAKTVPDPKLHPSMGHARHPWIEKQAQFDNSENKFTDQEERSAALSAYYGLISWLDFNIGCILKKLEETGQLENTTIVYTSDHGDNAGARGLWGKSNMYEESVAVPLIMSGPEIPVSECETPVSLLDLSETILDHFDATLPTKRQGTSLYEILAAPVDETRVVFSEYHAAGSVSGAYMLRMGRWKLIHYEGFEPELFDLSADPEELVNIAPDRQFSEQLSMLYEKLHQICDPHQVNTCAFQDQAYLVERFGGKEKAIAETAGLGGGTPPPKSVVGA